jgi:hypothetical protein
MERMAARIAINRTVAGVHFPVDSAAGAALGRMLAIYLAERFSASMEDSPQQGAAAAFAGEGYGGADFTHANYRAMVKGDKLPEANAIPFTDGAPGRFRFHQRQLNWLWRQAIAEVRNGWA